MTNPLNLTLPKQKTSDDHTSKWIIGLLGCLLIVGGANLLVVLYESQKEKIPFSSKTLLPEATRELSLKLEKQGVKNRAAMVWQEYLAQSDLSSEEQAKIWYRIGKLYQEEGSYGQALEAYYRSEGHAKVSELQHELNRRIQESLEALGKFAALRYELANRVGMNPNEQNSGEEILAEIGTHKITKSEVDQQIEEQIERQLTSLAAVLPESQRNAQKEALLKRYSTSQERLRLLNQFILEEILYRKAREDRLTEDPVIRRRIEATERSVLAQQVLGKELADQIKITPGDLQTYFQAHQSEYVVPEQAQISHILVKNREIAEILLKELDNGTEFEDLAKAHSLDDRTKNQGGKIDSWIQRDGYVPGIGNSQEIIQLVFSTKIGEVAKDPVQSDQGFHIIKIRNHQAQRQKTFEESQVEVYRALRGQKEQEVRERFLSQLKDRYNVVIHTSRLHNDLSEKQDVDTQSSIAQ